MTENTHKLRTGIKLSKECLFLLSKKPEDRWPELDNWPQFPSRENSTKENCDRTQQAADGAKQITAPD